MAAEPWLPLRGVRWWIFSMFVPGRSPRRSFADLGAEVIKVEPRAAIPGARTSRCNSIRESQQEKSGP